MRGYGTVSQAEEQEAEEQEAAYAAAAAKVAEQRAKLSGEVIEADERRGARSLMSSSPALRPVAMTVSSTSSSSGRPSRAS